MKVGDKVTYVPEHGNFEEGIIKEMHPAMNDHAWVVFHCNNDWNDYKNYTGQLTSLTYLRKGWNKHNLI